tara:strand:- start:108 stop:1082 length:975 start_codon:yes stop_codon:yes gene_type:complete
MKVLKKYFVKYKNKVLLNNIYKVKYIMNIGIFGVGSFGEKHINVIKNMKEINIIGFYDPNPFRCTTIEKSYNIKSFSSELELLHHCDAIDIVSSTETHYKLIKLGVEHKKHIFVEKPICCTENEVAKLLTQQYKHVIQIGHIERYNPAIKLDLIDKNKITEIKARRTGIINERNKNSSIVLDLMIHDIDLIMQMINSRIKSIKTIKQKSNTSESITTNIIFENEKKAQLIAERGVKVENNREMIIQLMNKEIKIDFLNRTQEHTTRGMKSETFKLDKNINPLKMELLEFYYNTINKKEPTVGVQEACNAVSVALKIEQLSKSNE